MGWSNRRFRIRAPVVILRDPEAPGFHYTDAEWVKVAMEHPGCNQKQLMDELERAGQRYQASRRGRRPPRRAPKRALIRDALQAWSEATGDIKLKVSRTHDLHAEWGPPDGPLIRYLEAALQPIMGEEMIGREALFKAIRRSRR
jgi:hypothetical protein